ncbi:hypothetical protein B0A53_02739 [Rhodotorula sp. CCFEE 5036]|nr:hypothetical protein B0A53_02739 [Rhodotorula sp. CCFEE 5036]
MRSPTTMHLSVQTHAQPGSSRPVTFAIPPSPRLREDGLLATGSGTTPPVTPPAFDRSNPFNSSTSSAAASPSGASFLSRLSRKLSVGKSSLSRRASSKGSRRQDEPESPRMARGVSFAESTKPDSAAPCECIGSSAVPAAPLGRRESTGLGLRRSLRVGNRRATGDQISSRGSAERTAARETRQRTAEVHSNLGSYFWSDSLGVCWDGRERVHPDLLFAAQPYTSDADYIPIPQAQTSPSARVVYASTLSSFPPRPPLRPRSPELSPAAQIIAEYRAQHGTLTPSIRSLDLGSAEEEEEEENGASTVTAPTIRPPSPVLRTLRIAIDDFAPEGARTDSPVSTRSSASQDARKLFAYASPGGHGSPGGGGDCDDNEGGDRPSISRAESDTSVEDDQMSTTGPAAPVKSAAHAAQTLAA